MKTGETKHEAVSDRHRRAYAELLSMASDARGSRRDFLKLAGASIALAGLAGCSPRQPVAKIVPYVKQPEEVVPGKPQFYATAMTLGGYAIGLLAESHEGRPTKIEGNPNHPASLGSTNVFAQASVLDLYDPDRSQTPLYLGEIRTWGDFLGTFRRELAVQRSKKGAGLRILTQTISSPTLADQLQTFLGAFPEAKWHQYEPLNRDNALAGAQQAFGDFTETIYHFDKAKVVLSLGSDFLGSGPASVRYSRDFMSQRRVRHDRVQMNRLYVVESTISNTGAIADHRLPIKASEIAGFTQSLAAALNSRSGLSVLPNKADWLEAVARDLLANPGAGIVLAGDEQPPTVHTLVHQLNQSLGNSGKTIIYSNPVIANPTLQVDSLRELVTDMANGHVELLIILGGNPVYDAPSDFYFADNLQKVSTRVHHSLYYDETSELCQWHINAAHYLESWSDARAFDGTTSIVQPLIAPLYSGKTEHELLAACIDQPDQSSYDLVRGYWLKRQGATAAKPNNSPVASLNTASPSALQSSSPNTKATTNAPAVLPNRVSQQFEQWWSKVLRDGVIEGTAEPPKNVSIKSTSLNSSPGPAASSGIELLFLPDPSIYDGRFANNGWLQELPKPFTKLTWDNAALISPATAERLGLSVEPNARGGEHGRNDSPIIEIVSNGKSVKAPIWILPGQPDDLICLPLGYGRTRAGALGSTTNEKNVGFNAYRLRSSTNLWITNGEIRNTGEVYELACTQAHYNMEGRELVRVAAIDEYKRHPDFAKLPDDRPADEASIYPGWRYDHYAWGMSIDTGACIGCNACVVACQAENNIPVVGKEEVMHAREMHWIRIDRYFENVDGEPRIDLEPVPCQQCENAPCELVCPVEATTHSDEGLNEMTYNRCVGTRYCSNNCPYKVRRFNFFEYGKFDQPLLKLQRNPEVSVRSRGVMEKCTYCVQRISAAKIESEVQNRRVRDGEIAPACQQVCPVQAIVFGDINDPNSRVSNLKREPADYGILAELNTRPRTTYLAKIRNPNPELMKERGNQNG